MGAELFHADDQTDRQTDMTKPIVTFRKFANEVSVECWKFHNEELQYL
jgi:hypothetical protein